MNRSSQGDHPLALNCLFPHKVCINLDRRTDRWQRVARRFARQGIQPVVRVSAVDGRAVEIPDRWNDVPGAFGCLESHLSVVRTARLNGWPTILIFEDDVVLDDEFNVKFAHCAAQLPDDWDMLLLGGTHWEDPVAVSTNVYRTAATVATHAWALKHTLYDAFIDINAAASEPVDVNNTKLQKEFNSYCFVPHLTWQEEDYSDIAEADYRPNGADTKRAAWMPASFLAKYCPTETATTKPVDKG